MNWYYPHFLNEQDAYGWQGNFVAMGNTEWWNGFIDFLKSMCIWTIWNKNKICIKD